MGSANGCVLLLFCESLAICLRTSQNCSGRRSPKDKKSPLFKVRPQRCGWDNTKSTPMEGGNPLCADLWHGGRRSVWPWLGRHVAMRRDEDTRLTPLIEDHLEIGSGDQRRSIALIRRSGGTPGLFWISGYRSSMLGTKAVTVDRFGEERHLAVTRFDYSGHGHSGGRFEDGTISRWLEEARAAFDTTIGPQIVIGSSMGGWLALLLAGSIGRDGAAARIDGMILIAPAVDMTKALMWDAMNKKARSTLARDGIYYEPNPYSDEPTPITKVLIEDGAKHLFEDRLIETGCPVHILQGKEDSEVPYSHATDLVERLASDDVELTLVKDGDHRLSRPQDLELLTRAIANMIGGS